MTSFDPKDGMDFMLQYVQARKNGFSAETLLSNEIEEKKKRTQENVLGIMAHLSKMQFESTQAMEAMLEEVQRVDCLQASKGSA